MVIHSASPSIRDSYTYTLKASIGNSANFRCVDYRSRTLASTDRYVAQDTPNGVVKHLDHPVSKMLRGSMNRYATSNQTLKTALIHCGATGNGYLRRKRYADGFEGWINWNPFDVVPYRFDDVKYFYVTSEGKAYLDSDFMHFMRFSLDGLVGMAQLEAFADIYQLGSTLHRYEFKYFKRMQVISGTLESPLPLTKEQYDQCKDDLSGLTLDSDRNNMIPILPFGLAWKPQGGINNDQTKIFEALDRNDNQVGDLHGLKPLFSDNYSDNIEDIHKALVTTELRGDFEDLEAEATKKMLTQQEQDDGYYVVFDEDSLMRGDLALRQFELTEVNAGVRSANHYAAKYDLPFVPGGDVPRMPHAVAVPVENTGKADPTEPPKAEPQTTGGTGGVQPETTFSVEPLIEAVATRVRTKEDKAFARAKDKPDFGVWRLGFSTEQGEYLRKEIAPVIASADLRFDVDDLVERYTTSVANRKDDATVDLNAMIKKAINNE